MTFEKIHIGTAVLDLATNKLTNSKGIEFHVNHKSMELLRILSSRAGNLVGRDELIEDVFEGNRFSGDKRLSDEVYRVRDLLTKAGIDDVVVKTIPRKGYVLINKVAEEASVTQAISAGENEGATKAGFGSYRLITGVAAAVALVTATFMLVNLSNENRQLQQENRLLQSQISDNDEIVQFFEKLIVEYDPATTTAEERSVRRDMLQGAERILASQEGNVETRAVLLSGLVRLYLKFEMLREAERHAIRAVELNAETYGTDSSQYADSQLALASVYRFSNSPAKARESYLAAMDAAESAGAEPRVLAGIYAGIGNLCLTDYAMCEEGREYLHKSLEIRTEEFGKYNREVFNSLEGLGLLHQLANDTSRATFYYDEAIDVITELEGHDSWVTLRVQTRLASALQQGEDFEKARELALYVEHVYASLDAQAYFRGMNFVNLANSHLSTNRVSEAANYADLALQYLDIQSNRGNPRSISIAFAQMVAGDVSARKNQVAEATRLYEESIEKFSHYFGPEHMYTRLAEDKLETLGYSHISKL